MEIMWLCFPWGWGSHKRNKGNKDDHQEGRAAWPRQLGCEDPGCQLQSPSLKVLQMEQGTERGISTRFREHSAKHQRLTGREEVTEDMEKEQLTAPWKT